MEQIVDFIRSLNSFDLVVLFALLAAFFLGFLQGTIRRLLGIGSILLSFLLAANLREPVGNFLEQYWTNFPPAYTMMLAFGGVFLILIIITTILIQGLYKRIPLFANHEVVDEVLGGILGIVQALMLIGAGIFILGSYFQVRPGLDPDELTLLRSLWEAISQSQTYILFTNTLIPAFLNLFGGLVPPDLRLPYVSV